MQDVGSSLPQLTSWFPKFLAMGSMITSKQSVEEVLPQVHTLDVRHPEQRMPTVPFPFPAPRFPIRPLETPASSDSLLSTSGPHLPEEQPIPSRGQPFVADNRAATHTHCARAV